MLEFVSGTHEACDALCRYAADEEAMTVEKIFSTDECTPTVGDAVERPSLEVAH